MITLNSNRKGKMSISRKFWRLLPFAIVGILVWCIILQENFLLDRTEVRQEIVYKFSALQQKQLGSNFESLKKSDAIDKQIIDQLLLESAMKKSVKKNITVTIDKTRTWFDRKNPHYSNRSLSAHPIFPGYVIENPDLCKGQPVDILIYVQSAVDHFERRRAIRETWGGTKLFHDISIKTLFVLGLPASDSDQMDVLTEYAAHGDIVQGKFQDNFRNLTMKAITVLVWVNWYCPHAKYLMKADDDYFIDTFGVVEDLLPNLSQKKTTFQCRYAKHFEIIRNTKVKWHIPSDILPSKTHWPPFCSGFFVLFTGDVIPILYENSFNITDYISVDDAYLFGLLTERNPNIKFIDIRNKVSVNTRPTPTEEISHNVMFEFSVFEIELPESTLSIWDLRIKRLSDWGRAHSLYVKLFEGPHKRTVNFL